MQLHSFQAFFMYRDASLAVFSFCLHRQTDRPNLPCASRVYPSLRSHQRRPLAGEDWLHEPKWDGIRFQVIKVGSVVWLYSRNGADYTERLPGMRKAFAAALPVVSAIIDGELYLVDLPARHGSGTHVVCATKSSLPYEGSCPNAAGLPQRMLGTCGGSSATTVV